MKLLFPATTLLAVSWLSIGPVLASPTAYTIDPSLSSISITPTVVLYGVVPLTVTPQDAGSYTASYSGHIDADLTASSIQLLSSTQLIAGNSGNWKPGVDYSSYDPSHPENSGDYLNATAPANYGLITDLTPLGSNAGGQQGLSPTAIRDLIVSLTDASARPITAGTFDPSGSTVTITSGTVYYSSGGSPPITDLRTDYDPDIDILSPTNPLALASLIDNGNVETLTLPVGFRTYYSINGILDVTTEYTGQIVATRAVPEPALLSLVTIGALSLLSGRQRRRV